MINEQIEQLNGTINLIKICSLYDTGIVLQILIPLGPSYDITPEQDVLI